MLYDALRSVLMFVRTASQCLESLDQNARMHCAERHSMVLPVFTDDSCRKRETTFDTTITVAELRDRIATLEAYLEQILRGIYKGPTSR